MTISPFIIYLWGISEQAASMFIGFGVAFSALASISIFSSLVGRGHDEIINPDKSIHASFWTKAENPRLRKETTDLLFTWGKRMACLGVVGILIGNLTPDKKTIACMVIVPAIVDSKVVQTDIPELYNLAVDALKETLKKETK